METENRGVVETSFQVINLSLLHGDPYHGFRFHVLNRESGGPGKALEVKIPFIDFKDSPIDYPAKLREIADRLEELQKEAESW